MKLLIKNGRLIDPANKIDGHHTLLIEDGFVAALDPGDGDLTGIDTEIDASGLVVCPGLVDLRARLREPGLEFKATMDSELSAAVEGGITTLCVPPDTDPVIDTPAMAQMVQQRAWQIGKCFVHPLGALTLGLKGEQLSDMASLEAAGCVGVSNGLNTVANTLVMRRAMQYASTFGLTVFVHAQDAWLTGNGCVHEGEISTRLGLPAIPEATETAAVARELALIETTGASCHFCGLSTARAVDMIARAQAEGLPVTADVTAHHLHLSEHDIGHFNTLCHVIPPLRSERDRERLRAAVHEGTVTAVCSDHQPHEMDAKLLPFSESEPGISRLNTLLPLTLKLVEQGVTDMVTAIDRLTAGPARVLGIDAGHLAPGATADLCIFDPDCEWQLDRQKIASRGKNTPFEGWPMPARVCYTLIGGDVIYRYDEL